MSAGTIWWGQIGNSIRFLEQINSALRSCQSAVLRLHGELPWREEFYSQVDMHRSIYSGERRMRRVAWKEGEDPGKFVMEEFCPLSVRAEYWPAQTRGAYLGSRDDIVLCEYYVWIMGIRSRTDLARWLEFLGQYRAACTDGPEAHAVFILEYTGEADVPSGAEIIDYRVEDYDCRVFALEAAASLNNTRLRTWQAELALQLSGADPELCFPLLTAGEKLLLESAATAVNISSQARNSAGGSFAPLTEEAALSAVWKASVVQIFPVLEQFRMEFISRYKQVLRAHLPVRNSNGDIIRDARELELGTLYYIVNQNPGSFSAAAGRSISLFRRVRNELAHNDVVPYAEVKHILGTKTEAFL